MYPEHLFFVLCQTSTVIVLLSSFRFNENSCNCQQRYSHLQRQWLNTDIQTAPFTLWFHSFSLNLLLFSPLNSQFLFVVTFTTFLVNCVDYDVLFANRAVNHTGPSQNPLDRNKVTLPDAILPTEQCTQR